MTTTDITPVHRSMIIDGQELGAADGRTSERTSPAHDVVVGV